MPLYAFPTIDRQWLKVHITLARFGLCERQYQPHNRDPASNRQAHNGREIERRCIDLKALTIEQLGLRGSLIAI